jgi:catechol 2,3-dioxygenase-like lactoylglutathione lyase family enzyme
MRDGGRGIDHLVLAVRDLDAAAAAYQRLGFTVTPPAVHPFGTGNRLVQLDGNFVELLGLVEPAKIVPPTPTSFSFSDFNARFLERRQGLSMVVLDSADARHDHAAFGAAGLRTFEPVDFARDARQPDGRVATVAFSVCFVLDEAHPELPMFVCQQHYPENFWRADYQRHANGAMRIVEVTVAVERPAGLAPFYGKLFGADAVSRQDDGLVVATTRGIIRVLSPDRLAARYPDPAAEVPCYAGYRVAVAELGAAAALLRDRGVPFVDADAALGIGPAAAGGTVLELVQG